MIQRIALVLLVIVTLSGCGSSRGSFSAYDKNATACYYADKFNGRKTANGEPSATAS